MAESPKSRGGRVQCRHAVVPPHTFVAAFLAWHSHTRHLVSLISCLASPASRLVRFCACVSLTFRVHALPRFALGSLSHLAALRAWHSLHTPCRASRLVPPHALLRFSLGTLTHNAPCLISYLWSVHALPRFALGSLSHLAAFRAWHSPDIRLAALRAWYPHTPCCVSRLVPSHTLLRFALGILYTRLAALRAWYPLMPCCVSRLELSRTTHLASFLTCGRYTPCHASRLVPSHTLLRFALGIPDIRLAALRAWYPHTPCCVSRLEPSHMTHFASFIAWHPLLHALSRFALVSAWHSLLVHA